MQYTISEFDIDSKHLNQLRKVNCCVPKEYIDQSLPVLILLDGGVNERLNFVLDQVSELLSKDKIIPFIIVGIENIDRNFDFTTPTKELNDLKWVSNAGNAKLFKKFITNELIPLIKEDFKVQDDFGIIGESLGGLLVIDLLLDQNQLFNRYIAIDPSLWWNKNQFYLAFIEDLKEKEDLRYKLWFSSSKTKSIRVLIESINQEVDLLNTDSINFYYDLEASHFTIYEKSLFSALAWMYQKS